MQATPADELHRTVLALDDAFTDALFDSAPVPVEVWVCAACGEAERDKPPVERACCEPMQGFCSFQRYLAVPADG